MQRERVRAYELGTLRGVGVQTWNRPLPLVYLEIGACVAFSKFSENHGLDRSTMCVNTQLATDVGKKGHLGREG